MLPPDKALSRAPFGGRKNKMQVVGAVMHKLIRVVYGILKSGQPFDPNQLLPAS
ncbi:hypothetical protein CKA32_006128 [Geitlerinema sp. FC II]|nr:hypothetical protein CKA32_006128 [Geitlerinema sp. FC II]